MVIAMDTRSNKRFLRSEEHGDELLPGIPNEITLDLITPKLSWRDFRILASVSRCWQEAIRTHEVYDARVRANSTEALIVHRHVYGKESVALYSTSEKRCYELPPLPWIPSGSLLSCQLIASDGKLYVFRGQQSRRSAISSASHLKRGLPGSGVYVLDLAGQGVWEQCASMLEPRFRHGCGVVDGRIYAFGGVSEPGHAVRVEPRLKAEVYDPQENQWSPIMPMTRGRFSHQVATVGKELLLWDGQFWSDTGPYSVWHHLKPSSTDMPLEVYNPAKDEWRVLELFEDTMPLSRLFVAKEKLYLLSQSRIDMYDFDQKSWVNRHTNSFGAYRPSCFTVHVYNFILAVNDELFFTPPLRFGKSPMPALQCKGFNSEKKEMVWQKTNCSKMMGAILSIEL